MKTQLIYEIVVENPYMNENRKELSDNIIHLLNNSRRSNVLKIWFLTECDAENAFVDVVDLKYKRFPRAVVYQNRNYIMILWNGAGYVEPVVCAAKQPTRTRSENYDYSGVLSDFVKSEKHTLEIKAEIRFAKGKPKTKEHAYMHPKTTAFRKNIERLKLNIEVFSRGDMIYLIKKEGAHE